MANDYFSSTNYAWTDGETLYEDNMNNLLTALDSAFDDIETDIDNLLVSPALTGTPTAPTATAGTDSTQIATTAFVAQTAFVTALPSQLNNSSKFLTTDGTNASWVLINQDIALMSLGII